MAGLGALVIKPADGLLWMPAPEAIEVVEPSAIITLQQITKEVLRRVVAAHPMPVAFIDAAKIGGNAEGITLNHQWNVHSRLPLEVDRYGLEESHITPIANLFIDRLGSGVKGCGKLILPNGGARAVSVTDKTTNLTVRGIEFYDIYEGDYQLRFDMLVAQ